MRIAIISPTFPPQGAGGIGSYSMHHAAGLAQLGHGVDVFTWLDPEPGNGGFPPGVAVHRIPDYRVVSSFCRVSNALWRAVWRILERDRELSAYGFMRNLRGSLTIALVFLLHYRSVFDVIESPEWGAPGAFLHLVSRRSIRVVKCHASDYSHAINYRPYFRLAAADVACGSMLERLSLRHARAVLSPSRALLPEIRDNLGFRGNVHVVPNEINPEVCRYLKEQAVPVAGRDGPGGRSFTVFCSGRLDQLKGLETIKRVLPVLSRRSGASMRFVFAGDVSPGVAREVLAFTSSVLEVSLLGAVSQQAVFANLLASDLLFFPSWTENCPMAILEAMALEVPVVASNVGGIPELIQHDINGILCGRDQPEEFAEQIVRLQNDPDLRDRLARNARDVVARRFASPVLTQKWLDAFQGTGQTSGRAYA